MLDATDRAALIDPDMPNFAQATLADLSTVDGLFRITPNEAFGLIRGNNPVFICDESMAPARHDLLTINAIQYKVAGHQPDGHGFVSLDLEAI